MRWTPVLDFDPRAEIDRALCRFVFTLVDDDRKEFVTILREVADFYEKGKDRAIFDCNGCGESTIDEYYMLYDDVWRIAAPDEPQDQQYPTEYMLCIGCVEKRLRRLLVPSDFPHYPVNSNDNQPRSERLLDRLGLLEKSA